MAKSHRIISQGNTLSRFDLRTDLDPDEGLLIAYVYDSSSNQTYEIQAPGHDNSSDLLLIDNDSRVREYVYDDWNEIKSIKDHHGFAEGSNEYILKDFSYDKFGRTTYIKYSFSTDPDAAVESYAYKYDKNNNITEEKHVSSYQNAENVNETRKYVYDSLGRLTDSSVIGSNNSEIKYAYGYDKVGNRTYENAAGVKEWALYNGLDQIVSKKMMPGPILQLTVMMQTVIKSVKSAEVSQRLLHTILKTDLPVSKKEIALSTQIRTEVTGRG